MADEPKYIDPKKQDTSGDDQTGTTEDVTTAPLVTAVVNRISKKADKPHIFPGNLNPNRYMGLVFISSDSINTDTIKTMIAGDRNKYADVIRGFAKEKKPVYLPIPNNISEVNSHNWSEVASNMVKYAADKTKLGQAGQQLAALMARRTLNASNMQVYSGPGARSFTFDYMFTPRNADDAARLKTLLVILKKQSAPRKIDEAGNSLIFPDMVSMFWKDKERGNQFLEDVLQTKLFVVENINTNYSPDGNMTMFDDGTPKQVLLSITFKEFTPKLYGSWEDV